MKMKGTRLIYKTGLTRQFLLLGLIMLFQTFSSVSQIKITPSSIDFGKVGPATDRVADILIKNLGDTKTFVLRTDIPMEFEYLYTSKSIEPDSTVVLRVKFKPHEKGNYADQINLYFSTMDEPKILPVTANVQFLDPNDNLPCPDFSQRVAECCPSNMFLAEVVDKVTNEPIGGAEIKIMEQAVTQLKLKSSSDGFVTQFVPIGYYVMIASKKGYAGDTIISYVNKQHHFFKFYLTPDSIQLEEEEVIPVVEMDSLVLIEPVELVEDELLPVQMYKANNIVFLVDVSQSMAASDKMDLMKTSLVELAGALRSIDQMGLVSYASDASMLLESTSGDQKEAIVEIVKTLDPGGSTSGAKGFKKALEEIKRNFIEGGNNQLIVITDGAFQTEDQEGISKLVKKFAKKNIRTSIVGIHSTEYATKNLTAYVTLGGGSFVPIDDADDSRDALLEEIRKMSRR